MANKLSSTNEVKEEKLDRTHPPPVFWIPFGIAGGVLAVVGFFRFSEKTDNIYFIYICLIAFTIAAFPWVSSIRLKGIFEINRAIDNVREESRDRVDQASKRFDDRLLSLRTELVSQLNSIQSQVVQQTSLQTSRQSQILNLNGLKSVEVADEALKKTDTGELEIKLPPSNELPEKYSKLRIGFVKATAAALNDPFGFNCGKLLRQIPENGQSSQMFEEERIKSNVTIEQVRTMKTLGLITEEESVSGETDEAKAIINISELGRIYANYWNEFLKWSKIGSAALKIIPWLVRIFIT